MALIELFNCRLAKLLIQTVSLRHQLQSISLILKIIYQLKTHHDS